MPDRIKKLAFEFYDFATQELSAKNPGFELRLMDRNWLWGTYASYGQRSCTITSQIHFYQLAFAADSKQVAAGVVDSRQVAISAVTDWLRGSSLDEMYSKHDFVDRGKRLTERFWNFAVESYPDLALKTTPRVDSDFSRYSYWLWIFASDRSCKIFCGWDPKSTVCEFYWDECYLMRLQNKDYSPLTSAIHRWLCDYAKPSELEQEFSLCDIDELARHYENGRGVEGEFIQSWDKVVGAYDRYLTSEDTPEILNLITQMREAGYDKKLRAGQSLFTLVLSRSRRHGLRHDQPRIVFAFSNNSMDLAAYLDGGGSFHFPKIEFTPEVDLLLKRLTEMEID